MKETKAICLEMHTSMETILPSDLTLNILSRLPADSVLQCRQVLKSWKDLLRQPSFPWAHLLHQLSLINGNSFSSPSSHTTATASIPFGLLFFFSFTLERGNQLYYGEYDSQSRNKLRKINQPLTVGKSVIGSCNGLICFSENYPYHVLEPSYVCNPVTGEYVNIPRGMKRENIVGYSEFIVCGFGYHPSINKYKIVKIHYTKTTHLGRVEVYTIGSGSGWRETGTTTYSLRPKYESSSRGALSYLSPFGTLANGALHWLNKEQKIVSFDLAKENVYMLPSPPFVPATSEENCYQLQVLGGCLCFVHEKRREYLDIWFLRKTGESSSYELNEQDDYELLTWIKEFSIPIEREAEPCALTNSGELLMQYKCSLFCYTPQSASLEKLMDNGFCYVLPHVNSFVSLTALGEKRCSFKKRYDVNPAPKEILIGKQPRKDDEQADA